jgi:3-oxoadipate enol-lactonase
MTPVRLHHVIDGPLDEAALLLGGSLGTTLEMWAPQVESLADRHQLVRFDHRGHGGSPVPNGPYAIADLGADVLALMDTLGLRRAAYCGLSIGGMVGQWLAINAPERITALIVLCTGAYLPPPDPGRQRAADVRAAGTPEVVADAVVGRWFTSAWAQAHPERVAAHRAMIAATDAEGYASCCEAIAAMDLRGGLGEITAPTLVIGGAQDPAIPVEHSRAIAQAVPGARLEVLDPGAHLASVERADIVTRLIADHIASAEKGAR